MMNRSPRKDEHQDIMAGNPEASISVDQMQTTPPNNPQYPHHVSIKVRISIRLLSFLTYQALYRSKK
jgi:hypothetical protein